MGGDVVGRGVVGGVSAGDKLRHDARLLELMTDGD